MDNQTALSLARELVSTSVFDTVEKRIAAALKRAYAAGIDEALTYIDVREVDGSRQRILAEADQLEGK